MSSDSQKNPVQDQEVVAPPVESGPPPTDIIYALIERYGYLGEDSRNRRQLSGLSCALEASRARKEKQKRELLEELRAEGGLCLCST